VAEIGELSAPKDAMIPEEISQRIEGQDHIIKKVLDLGGGDLQDGIR
jgi:hypothetical protein